MYWRKNCGIVGSLTFTLACFAATAAAKQPTKQEIVEHYAKAVVLVERLTVGESVKVQGSGVFYSPTRIVTNAHVIGDIPENRETVERVYMDTDLSRAVFWVTFLGKKYKARLVGRDPDLDLAILEIDHAVDGVRPARFGDSGKCAAGHEVYVFGNPLGMENSVTSGIVSGKERRIGMLSYEELIQTDAPINPGNSGGALVSMETGELLGIPNSKIPFADNMGFAVPINLFRDIEPQLQGTIKHSWLGISFPGPKFTDSEGFQGLKAIHELTGANHLEVLDGIRREVFDKDKGGVLVTNVMRAHVDKLYAILASDGENAAAEATARTPPALKAGFELGDVITKFGEFEIKRDLDLIRAIFRSKPRETLPVRIVRFDSTDKRTEVVLMVTPIVRNPDGVAGGFY